VFVERNKVSSGGKKKGEIPYSLGVERTPSGRGRFTNRERIYMGVRYGKKKKGAGRNKECLV